jgi:NAD(P)-dependent dehydrogenase (short-subunit alcohol dehydrogenase family)
VPGEAREGKILMLKGLAGKTLVVTGAAGEIGAAVCHRMAEEGCAIVAADIDGGAVEDVAGKLGDSVVPVVADVTTPEGAAACVEAAVRTFGRMDLFHANAGVECQVRPVADLDIADYDRVFAVNVRGAFLCAQAAVRRFVQQGGGGGLLFTASIAALMGSAGMSVYNSSKHAVHGLARCLSREVGAQGIRVNTLAPGVVDSRMMRSLEGGLGALSGVDAAGVKAGYEQGVPLGRYATPEEVAATAAWILSDEVPYLHGEIITVGGGIAP